MASKIQIKVEPTDNEASTFVVRLAGQIDESNLHELKEALEPVIDKKDVKQLLFDMEHLTFLNSRVIGYLISLYSNASEAKTGMGIVKMNEKVAEVLSLVGLTTLIKEFDSIEEAIQGL